MYKRNYKKVLVEMKKQFAVRVQKSDIATFFVTSNRNDNDATNKKRENILSNLLKISPEYISDPEYGQKWETVRNEWIRVIEELTSDYSKKQMWETKLMAGRKYNYDIELSTEDGKIYKIEFKYGGTKITELPQFLSLQAKVELFPVTFPQFYYDKYIDKYIACDCGISEHKPTISEYLVMVTKVNYDVSPFFAQLKERELIEQSSKNKVVNASITEYLNEYGRTINLSAFAEKVRATQDNKIYVLWANGKFTIDRFAESDLGSDFQFHGIRNGNILEVKSGDIVYSMLLRWRNHKGILNPAWQISLRR